MDKYIRAIAEYPTPTKTMDIRAWFGLVNQVSHYNQLTELMLPFKPFLSKNKKFEWSSEMNDIFERSKQLIIEAIREGLRIYDNQTDLSPPRLVEHRHWLLFDTEAL